ncbi:MAG: sigma 54-interacting transcriptional regulator [Candidatus Kuenenia sp.]|nr:sigma 54-interacting transcriptional regulator [Candidatus Kuenenia hertensis]
MIHWNKIINSHVSNTARKIGSEWWDVDLQFFDKHANSINGLAQNKNPFCCEIKSTSVGAQLCARNYRRHLRNAHNKKSPFVYKCCFGLFGIIAPMFIKDEYIGAIVFSGMKKPNSRHLEHNSDAKIIKKNGVDKNYLQNIYIRVKETDDHEESYIIDFLKYLVQDNISLYKGLKVKDELVCRQSAEQESVFESKYKGIVGNSTAIKKVFSILHRIEDIMSPILIDGESGTGKELIAATIHYNSPRRDKMFVVQNCSAFSETLLNSELFGHEKGAFTGATANRKGLFEIADGGTLFLDEIGDMHIDAQAKLLRVLQDGMFYSVGSEKPKKVDVRIVAATNRNLKEMIKQGKFRNDLFYRINTINITLPSLRERKEDIPLLCDYFLHTYENIHNVRSKKMSPEVKELLMAYSWPGNIRELKNLIERLVILHNKEEVINVEHIPEDIINNTYARSLSRDDVSQGKNLKEILKSTEKRIIKEELNKANWNKKVASKILGISRASLINKIRQYNLYPK